MNTSTRRLFVAALVTPSVTVFAQSPAAAPASAAPSQPAPNLVVNPGGPTWMVADVGIALVIGLVVGYLLGARRSSAKQRASHA